jgi:transcriptional regulator with XRE-family HTH domain
MPEKFGERVPVTADQGQHESQFGLLLRGHRLARGLSQEELAELSGLSVRAIIKMEHGRTSRPYRDSVQALADALDLPGPQREQLIAASRRFAAGGPASGPEAQGTAASAAAASQELSPGSARPVIPRELPATVGHFTGRAAELAALTALVDQAGAQAPGTVVISAIGGTAGVGKTALAVHWAHQVAGRFGNGQLYVNLRGFDPSGARSRRKRPSAGSWTPSACRPARSRRARRRRRACTAACWPTGDRGGPADQPGRAEPRRGGAAAGRPAGRRPGRRRARRS